MNKKHFWVKGFYLITLTLALAVVVSACTPQEQKKVSDTMTDKSASDDAMADQGGMEEVTVELSAQNNSDQTGTAVFKSEGANTKVTISLEHTPPNIAQPAHIHLNSCAKIGSVKYPLTSLINGQSETIVPVSLKDLTSKEQLSINVHKSAAEVSVYSACGDLPYSAMMTDDSKMMKDGTTDDTTMKDDTKSSDTMMKDDDQPGDSMMEAKVQTITVSGTNFAYSMKEIKVKKGDKIKLVFTSDSGFHDWVVDEFNARTARVNTGQTAAPIEFTADKIGTFEYYCSVGSHRAMGMVGKLIVE